MISTAPETMTKNALRLPPASNNNSPSPTSRGVANAASVATWSRVRRGNAISLRESLPDGALGEIARGVVTAAYVFQTVVTYATGFSWQLRFRSSSHGPLA